MIRVYRSIFAVVVKRIVFLKERIAARKVKRQGGRRLVFRRRASVDRKVAQTLCVVLMVALLATSSPSAPSTVAHWAREGQQAVTLWARSHSLSAKLYRTLGDSYGRYQNWLSARRAGKRNSTVAESNSTEYATTSKAAAVTPNPPLPPDPPPVFTEDPLVAGVTFVKALHITELRDAVNVVRARVGLPGASWELPVASGLPIKATHILELRTRLNDARTALGLPPANYSEPQPFVGGSIRAAHVQELRNRIKEMLGSTASSDSAVARLDPANRTGGGSENPLSRNYNWSVALLSLPGRSGLDLGLSLNYNSLVWTRRGSSISFDDDGGFPSPGFRLGFPVIQPLYYNSETAKYSFLLISPGGERVELRQVNASSLYESADSSHLLLDASTMLLRTTDGTQLSYAWMGNDYQCTQIKDRNGNFITVNYTALGRISTVVDTLGRVITFNYDGTNSLTSITQPWNGQNHIWASFEYYPAAEIHTDFQGLTVVGPQNGSTLKVLSKVILDDNSRFEFDYTYWGQIWKISNKAPDGHVLNYRAYNLPGNWLTPQSDCPRFTTRVDWVENWNRGGSNGASGLPAGAEQEVLTGSWIVPETASWTLPDGTPQTGTLAQATGADGTYNRIYFEGTAGTANGWKRGLPSLMETYGKTTPEQGSAIKQRASVTKWRQQVENVSYSLNPRVEETNIYDFNASGQVQNRARTTISYQTADFGDGTSGHLVQNIFEYQANAATIARRTHTTYNLNSAYLSRRIIGLVSEKELHEVDPNTLAETLMAKVGYQYDEAGSIQGTDAPIQHDNTNYSASFLAGRANLSSVKRFDVVNTSQFTNTTIRYNTAGSSVANIDPLGHQVNIAYADSFSDNNNSRNTLAFPTMVTDPDNFSSTAQYNFDFGLVTRSQSPPPAGQPVGAIKNFIYDSLARLQKVAIEFNGNADYSHARFEYSNTGTRIDTFTTIKAGEGEAHSFKILDGFGRVIASASDLPGIGEGFSGQLLLYDILGRAIRTSNPTETSASGAPSQWVAVGEDAPAGWLYTRQTYDWRGRALVTTNPDGTTKEASYSGCGCAGGEVVTLTDEGTLDGGAPKRRQQKLYTDVLGRTVKTEELNWQGGSVYSTIVNTYNARDQLAQARHYQGAEGSATFQDTTITYDGFGRLKTKHLPEYDAGTSTTYNYNSDDTIDSVVDPRGASQTFSYNARHLVTGISYSAPAGSGISIPPPATIVYDAAGNRTSVGDASSNCTYGYDQLSRLSSETHTFNGLSGDYALNYEYNLAGQLTKITDPTNMTINYDYDTLGRLGNVTGSDNIYGNVSQYAFGFAYRAWGGIKGFTYGNGYTLATGYNSRLQITQFEVAGRPAQFGPSTVMKTEFDYYADGAMKYARDLLDERFDRAVSYDHVAMLKEAYSGSEARDYVNGTNSGTQTGPYRQSYQNDVFGNMTNRENRFWSQSDTFTASYLNNRRQDPTFHYDSAGNLTQNPDVQFSYDAAGRNTVFISAENDRTIALTYDAKGQVIKRTESQPGIPTTVAYYVRSSVLGNKIITELSAGGIKQKGYVFAGGELLATQENGGVNWHHQNPLTGSAGDSRSDGWFQPQAEPDPTGVNVGFEDPFINCCFLPPVEDQIMPALLGDFGTSGRCTLDGISIDCGWAMQMLENGSAVQCPNNDCGPRSVIYQGQRTWAFFHAYADGYQGFVPNGARYTGNGGIAPIGSGGRPTLGRTGDRPDSRNDTNLGQLNGARHPEEDLGRTPQFFGAGFGGVFMLGIVPQNNPQTPRDTRSPKQKACDEKIARLFGGRGAIAATVEEPTTLLSDNRNRNPRATFEHMAGGGVFHIYTNAQGTEATVGLYRPPGGRLIRGGEYDNAGDTENYFRYRYSSGPYKGVEISFVHVGGTHGGEVGGKYLGKFPGEPLRVGNIGGPGGAGYGYNHSHIKVFYKGELTDPRKIFCKEFGF